MKYKLLAIDLDGTILKDNHQLNPYSQKLIQQLKVHYHVLIVTGRHHTAAKPYYEQLQLDTPIICCNGTYIYDYQQDTVLYENAINKDLATYFIHSSEQHQLKMVMYITDAMVYSLEDPIAYMKPLDAWAKTFPKTKQPNIYQTDEFTSLITATDYIWKFVVEGDLLTLQKFLQQDWIKDKFEGAWSASSRIDLAKVGNNKGNALAHYAKKIGIKPENIVAVGDNFNDIPMLRFAGVGIAMQQANAEVKVCADIISDTDNHGDGVARILQQHFPIDGAEE
ncbi:Cof-type HAD-IIB family hydrolase [Vibrio sp. 2-Bac 85]